MSADARFRALLEAAPDAMVIVAEDGTIQLVNAQAETLFGYDRTEMIGRPIEMLVPAHVRQHHQAHRLDYVREPVTRPMGAGLDLYARRKDGSEVPVEISLSPLRTPEGLIVISAIRDVTDRRRAEARFRGLLESAPDAMVIVDSQGVIVLVNAQVERLFGYTRGELLGRKVELLVPPRYQRSHEGHRRSYMGLARARPMGADLDLYGRHKDGTDFPVEISLSPLETDEGVLVASAIRDITDRRLAEQERARLLHERAAQAEASRVKDEFLATLSHELRTPLNAVVGWTALIREGGVPPDSLPKAIAIIERNARAQARLVEDLLDVSRIVSGSLRIQLHPIDFVQVVENAVDVVRPAAEGKHVALDVIFEQRPLLMTGDPDRLQQAVWNLLSNAVKFSSLHGRVDVRVWSGEQIIRLTVRDTGRGINPQFLPYIFDRFTQADSSYTRTSAGLGLGLAIVRSVIELHGGTVEASSPGENHGATFRVELPVVSATERARAGDAPASADAERLDGIRVLVVDDQPDERELIEVILRERGAVVDLAESADAALARIQEDAPAVLVSDIAMPGQDGYALLRRVRTLPDPVAHMPAIAVTAHARAEDRLAALSAGFQVYVPKPIDHMRLVRAVRELAERPKERY